MAMWHEKPNAINLRKTIMLDIKERFDNEGIEIPFPHLSIYTGEETKPFPVEINQQQNSSEMKN